MVPTPPIYSGTGARPDVSPYRHGGFYLGVHSGVGFFSLKGSGPLGDASLGGLASVADLRIGGTIAPGLVLGGVFREWTTTGTFDGGPPITATRTHFVNGVSKTDPITLSGNARALAFEVGAFIDWFPNPEKGWHVGASVGLGGVSVSDDSATNSVGGDVTGSIFGGYQWWIGPSWSLGLQGVLSGGTATKLDDSDQADTGYKLRPAGIGIQAELLYY
jgi:hypothetical protein